MATHNQLTTYLVYSKSSMLYLSTKKTEQVSGTFKAEIL